ncbi:MAG: amidohydrolase family protein [Woeseia sp.]
MNSATGPGPAVFALALTALIAAPVCAEVTAITGATVHTVGPQGSIENAMVLIEDGIVTAVGNDLEIPVDARRIDAVGKVVTPGLMTPMGQIGLVEVDAVAGTVDFIQRGDQFSAGFDVADAYNPRSSLVAINRIAGITHAVIAPDGASIDQLGNYSRVLSGLASVVHLGDADDYLLDRGVAVIAQLGETGGDLAAGSRAAALMILRTAMDDARDYASNRDAFEQGRRRTYSLSHTDLAALSAVLSGERKLVVDVHRASDISAALRLAGDYDIQMIIVGGTEAWLVAAELATAGVPVILDSIGNLPGSFERLNARLETAAILAEAGVKFAVGGDSFSQNHNARNITQAAGIAVANGLPWAEGLAAITLAPAEIFGLDEQIGSIEQGKRADLVIWNDDPLKLQSYPEQVMIGGRLVPMESRQTLLRDRYLQSESPLPPAFR